MSYEAVWLPADACHTTTAAATETWPVFGLRYNCSCHKIPQFVSVLIFATLVAGVFSA
jgi:hypothetical protein